MKPDTIKIDCRLTTGLKLVISAIILGAVFLLSSNARAQFTWPVYDSFGEYPYTYANTNDPTLTLQYSPLCLGDDVSSNNWDFGNPNQNWQVTNSAALSWPGLVPDPNAVPQGVQEIAENTTSADSGAMFTQQNVATIYASFLLNYQDNGGATANRCIFNLVTNAVLGSSDTRIFSSVWLTPDYAIVIDKNEDGGGTFTAETPTLVTNSPNLIVLRYKVVPGGNDEFDIWVNPPALGSDSLIPPPTISTTNGPNIPDFNGVLFSQRKEPNYQENVFQIDELRLGSDWAWVTPATPSPGTTSFGLTGGGTACPGVMLPVGISGSVTTNQYLLYTNGAYSGESVAGTGGSVSFGMQSMPAVYTVLATNATTANVGWLTNSVTITAIPAPVITTEPGPAISATNTRAEFKVLVSGSGFTYLWYLNGTPVSNSTNVSGGLTNIISGAQTNDLVISSATTANVGNYYCIISNSCGEYSITTTNALTLDQPNNLVYVGDAFGINFWGVGMTTVPEFTASGNPSFFNEGDNVTFNDSYNPSQYGSTITLSNTLTPTSITFSMSQGLTWGGPGTISGTGSLLVNGSGVLQLLNNSAGSYANTFSGGTTINGGWVNMPDSWTGLGTGPVTLSGGTLETDQKSSGTGSSLGLPVPLIVTANSTWQVDKTGNQCAGLALALLGNSGTTLLITNSATTASSVNEIRFNGGFTNGLSLVTAENSAATGSFMQIGAFNNSTNIQVYNGPISGPTAAFFVSGAGPVYLNGANTYTNPTYVTTGFLAGSGSIAGPLNVSSNATVGGGSLSGIGTFSVGMGMTMTNGSKVLIRVNKALSPQSNDLISVSGGVITNSGPAAVTVTITNIGAAPLVAGDTFQIFNQPVKNGATFTVTGGGVTWANNLAVNGSVQVTLGYVPLTTSPKITSFVLQSGKAIISGTNGQAGATAFLLTTTNLLTPLSQWQTVGTNILGGTGFTVTNAVVVGAPQRFYLLSSTNYNP